MTPAEQHALDVLRAATAGDWYDAIVWVPPLVATVPCVDWFDLGVADAVVIEPGEAEQIEACIKEVDATTPEYGVEWGPWLWACRKRKRAPHERRLANMKDWLRRMFEACGETAPLLLQEGGHARPTTRDPAAANGPGRIPDR